MQHCKGGEGGSTKYFDVSSDETKSKCTKILTLIVDVIQSNTSKNVKTTPNKSKKLQGQVASMCVQSKWLWDMVYYTSVVCPFVLLLKNSFLV